MKGMGYDEKSTNLELKEFSKNALKK